MELGGKDSSRLARPPDWYWCSKRQLAKRLAGSWRSFLNQGTLTTLYRVCCIAVFRYILNITSPSESVCLYIYIYIISNSYVRVYIIYDSQYQLPFH
jgi:hypothetical protein